MCSRVHFNGRPGAIGTYSHNSTSQPLWYPRCSLSKPLSCFSIRPVNHLYLFVTAYICDYVPDFAVGWPWGSTCWDSSLYIRVHWMGVPMHFMHNKCRRNVYIWETHQTWCNSCAIFPTASVQAAAAINWLTEHSLVFCLGGKRPRIACNN